MNALHVPLITARCIDFSPETLAEIEAHGRRYHSLADISDDADAPWSNVAQPVFDCINDIWAHPREGSPR